MKAHPPKKRLWALLLGVCSLAAQADEAPNPDSAQLRASVTKGLVFLDKEADTWMNDKTCNGCHHMPVLLWSHREARRRGFPDDQKQFDEFVDWSYSRTKDLRAGFEMIALLKLAMPEKPAPELTEIIFKNQQADGSWKPAGQLADMQRRGPADATVNSARLFLLALGTQPGDQAVTDAARAKAAPLLARNEPPKSIETVVVRALYAQRFGPPEDAASSCAELLKLQHSDGGWGYIVGEERSDSLATGEALYLLRQFHEAAFAGAITRAQAWLVAHQREDGGWPIDITRISKIDRSGEAKAKSFKAATDIYTYWGSAWATIGLEQAFPVVAPSH